jgi:hypothetical protein
MHSNHEGASYSRASRNRAAGRVQSELASTSTASINLATCNMCGSAEHGAGEMQFIMCDYSLAHEADKSGVHLGCACDISSIPEGAYKCLPCEEVEEAGGLHQAERIMMKRVAPCVTHTKACKGGSLCKCKPKTRTKYLVKWKGYVESEATWEFDAAIVDREIKSKFDKHVRDAKTAACKNQCRCQPVCICNDAVALQKALDSQKGAALDSSE